MLVDQVHNIIKIIWYQVSGIRYQVPNTQSHQMIPLNQEPEAGCYVDGGPSTCNFVANLCISSVCPENCLFQLST